MASVRTSTSARRPPSSPSPPSIVKGATARSAITTRPSTLSPASSARRSSHKTTASSAGNASGTHESLVASLKLETDLKEQLLVQVQNKDQTIANLASENGQLASTLNSAEQRLNDLYAEQARSEAELAQRIDISDKLRTQVRELEKEKRDIQRRYNEQAVTFDAERQAFYDNEQHLKSRILTLTQARKQPITNSVTSDPETSTGSELDLEKLESENGYGEHEQDDSKKDNVSNDARHQSFHDPETEPAEMTALRLELSTLSTSYASIQSTVALLQSQLVDLKRVNHELQEDNESYMILLREKTLSGQYDVMRQVGVENSTEDEGEDAEYTDVGSLRSLARSALDRVEEEQEHGEENFERQLRQGAELDDLDHRPSRVSSRQPRKRNVSTSSGRRGETLADLPITGPGLDLAAELGRAENRDMLVHSNAEDAVPSKPPRSKKVSGKGLKSDANGPENGVSSNDIDALRNEVKSLKDANKALSLYASKIIDRIIAQEGFEHVLAVDYDSASRSPQATAPAKTSSGSRQKDRPKPVSASQSPMHTPDTRLNSSQTGSAPKPHQPSAKAHRRSLSFDWKSFSLFNSSEKKPDPYLRPLTLKPGTSPVTGGRKLDNEEDDEDRRERERLNATMKLLGIEPSSAQPSPALSSPTIAASSPAPNNSHRRFSLFGVKYTNNPESPALSQNLRHPPESTANSRVGLGISAELTREALQHAEAENTIATLDAHERTLSAEIARGGNSGYTEIAPRATIGRRSRRSAGGSGSGSTIWSAGMSGAGDDE